MKMSQLNSCIAIKQNKNVFFQKQRTGKENRFCLGVGTSVGEDIRKGCRKMNVVEYYVLMYENGKIRAVETIPGKAGGE
jgi:hypothetical protein